MAQPEHTKQQAVQSQRVNVDVQELINSLIKQRNEALDRAAQAEALAETYRKALEAMRKINSGSKSVSEDVEVERQE